MDFENPLHNEFDPKTTRKYELTCRIKPIRKSWKHVRGNMIEDDMVLLIPEDNDQRTFFFNAWLPDMEDEYFELASVIHSPVFSPSRLSIHRKGKDHPDSPYLFVMSEGVAKELLQINDPNFRIRVTILSELEDEACDEAKDDDILRDYSTYQPPAK